MISCGLLCLRTSVVKRGGMMRYYIHTVRRGYYIHTVRRGYYIHTVRRGYYIHTVRRVGRMKIEGMGWWKLLPSVWMGMMD